MKGRIISAIMHTSQKGGSIMDPNNPLIKEMLNQLNERYHQPIGGDSQILPDHQDRDEIKDCIQYCIDKEWIAVEDISIQRGGNREYFSIRLIPDGLDYLHTIL